MALKKYFWVIVFVLLSSVCIMPAFAKVQYKNFTRERKILWKTFTPEDKDRMHSSYQQFIGLSESEKQRLKDNAYKYGYVNHLHRAEIQKNIYRWKSLNEQEQKKIREIFKYWSEISWNENKGL